MFLIQQCWNRIELVDVADCQIVATCILIFMMTSNLVLCAEEFNPSCVQMTKANVRSYDDLLHYMHEQDCEMDLTATTLLADACRDMMTNGEDSIKMRDARKHEIDELIKKTKDHEAEIVALNKKIGLSRKESERIGALEQRIGENNTAVSMKTMESDAYDKRSKACKVFAVYLAKVYKAEIQVNDAVLALKTLSDTKSTLPAYYITKQNMISTALALVEALVMLKTLPTRPPHPDDVNIQAAMASAIVTQSLAWS